MKKLIFLIVIFLFTSLCYSQSHVETYYREYCFYNDDSQEFDDCNGYEEISTFDIADDWSYWVHTTPKMQSTYYVIDTKYMEEYGLTFYYVESDVGNNYIYVFDILKDEIRIFGKNKEGEEYILTFYVNKWE